MKRPKTLESYTADATTAAPDRPSSSTANGGPGGRVRRRDWERQPENKKFSYRVGADVNDLLKEEVAAMKGQGFLTTVSDMARAWLLAGYEQWAAGNVEVEGKWLESGTASKTD